MDRRAQWLLWAFGTTLDKMSDADIRLYARRAWDSNDGGLLRMMRAEAKRRVVLVA